MSHSITWDQDIQSITTQFKDNQRSIAEHIEKMNKRIEHETFFEKKELEKAVSKYNKKVDRIMNEKEMVNYTRIVKEKSEENVTLATRAFKHYRTEHDKIVRNTQLSEKEKLRMEKNLLLSIGNHLLSDDARERFQSLVENSQNDENLILLL